MKTHHRITINHLEKRLSPWRMLALKSPRPKEGWVRTIRKALGMSTRQLAARLGLHRSRIVQLEHAEIENAVTLQTLKTVADAMGCELVYAIVPRKTFHDFIKDQAVAQATKMVKRVAHSMALEDQATTKSHQKEQLDHLVKTFLDGPLKKLWEE